jgi:hypothetical protein
MNSLLLVVSLVVGLPLLATLGVCGGGWALVNWASVHDERRQAELLATKDDACREASTALDAVDADIAAGRDVSQAVTLVRVHFDRYVTFLHPVPPDVDAVNSRLRDRESFVAAVAALQAAPSESALEQVRKLEFAAGELGLSTAEFKAVPEVARVLRELDQRQKELAPQAAKERKEQAAAAETRARCGAPPELVGGTFVEAEQLLRITANDPSSIETSYCQGPEMTKRCWKVTCIVRGKNGFGALIAVQQTFYMDATMIHAEEPEVE